MRPDLDESERLDDLPTWTRVVERALAKAYPPPGEDAPEGPPEAAVALSPRSNWALVCEELLDVAHPSAYLRACYAELLRRGKTPEDIATMRRVAWLTAGWLNYGRMAWDRTSLDEDDIVRALDWQGEEGQLPDDTRQALLAVVERHRG